MSKASLRVGIERIRALADFVDNLPPKRFYFGTWVGKWEGKKDLSCGTTACALGWATTMPRFKRLGLELRKEEWGVAGHIYPGEDEIADMFGIPEEVFQRLFIPYANRKDREFHDQLGPRCTNKQWAMHARRIAYELEEPIRKARTNQNNTRRSVQELESYHANGQSDGSRSYSDPLLSTRS